MIGDVIIIKERHLKTAENIYKKIKEKITLDDKKIVIGIGGESGSGKSVTAFALAEVFKKNDMEAMVFQQDDYFFLPPKTNHEARVKDIHLVGENEVNLFLLAENCKDFKTNSSTIAKPLVNYQENTISTDIISLDKTKVLILEGTYIIKLNELDVKVFIDRNYKDTYENRMLRNRGEASDFVEKVLDIEHQIIKEYKKTADIILDKEYNIATNK